MTTVPTERSLSEGATRSGETVLSVRGEALRMVAPDYAVLNGVLSGPPGGRSAVLAAVRERQDHLVGVLRSLGGEPFAAGAPRVALSWPLGSMSVYDDHEVDRTTKRRQPTDRVVARSSVMITVRDFERLASVAEAIATIEHLSVHSVGWYVDRDNDGWRIVAGRSHSSGTGQGGRLRAGVERPRRFGRSCG